MSKRITIVRGLHTGPLGFPEQFARDMGTIFKEATHAQSRSMRDAAEAVSGGLRPVAAVGHAAAADADRVSGNSDCQRISVTIGAGYIFAALGDTFGYAWPGMFVGLAFGLWLSRRPLEEPKP